MTNQTKKNIIRWILSSLLTFLTGISLVLVTNIDDITLGSFKDGTFVGIIFVAVRAGFKALLEFFLVAVQNKK